MHKLRERLLARLGDAAAELDSATRTRIESVSRSLKYRGEDVVAAWRAMLAALGTATPPEFVDWFSIARSHGRGTDTGLEPKSVRRGKGVAGGVDPGGRRDRKK